MNTQLNSPSVREEFIQKILTDMEGEASQESLLRLVETFHQQSELSKDILLLQSLTLLDFLAHQVKHGNGDLVTHKIIQECYTYILNTLLPKRGAF